MSHVDEILVTRRPAGRLYYNESGAVLEKLKDEAQRLDFSACGVSRCELEEQKVADA